MLVPLPFTSVTAYDLCSGTNITTAITDTTNSTCPLVVTRTWTFTDLCGNATNVSQQVFVTDNVPPVVDCACVAAAVTNLLANSCNAIPDLAFLAGTGCVADNCGPVTLSQSPAAGTIVPPGLHPITLTFTDCYGNSTNCVLTFTATPQLSAIFTPPNIHVLTCSNSAVVNYSLNYFGLFGTIVCSPPSGSSFPLGTNVVTCIGTNHCGVALTNTFKVIVRSARINKWACRDFVIAIPYWLTNRTGGGMSSARMVVQPNLPGGGHAANFENFATSGQDGPRFDFGAAEQFTFTTELDFNSATGAGFDLAVPPSPGETNGATLLRIRRASDSHLHVTRPVADPATSLRSIAIGTNGALFNSFISTAAELNTNVLLNLAPMSGATSVVMTVTLDCRTRELTLAFPFCDVAPDAARKGWDGCIYGNVPRGGTKTNKAARYVFTPLAPAPPVPVTNLDLIVTNLPVVAFDNPSLTWTRRRWSDDHVSLMKVYDDGGESGLDFTSLGDGGGVRTDLGHAASFEFRMGHFQTGDVPDQEQFFNLIDSLARTNSLRFTRTMAGVECGADFTQWGVSNVTVQLWDGTNIVGQTNLPATLASTLVTLADFPTVIGAGAGGVLKVSNTNREMTVVFGLACSGGPCQGDELRIIPGLSPMAPPPEAYTGLEIVIGDGMDNRISHLVTMPACVPTPINAMPTASGILLNWSGDGFRLEGAETLAGPWYDLGVQSPVTLPASSKLRLFRLRCD
jgi:hypothetical protein